MNYSLDNLTSIQLKKWQKFLSVYPDFCHAPTQQLELTSSDLGKILSSKSCNVLRDLERISKRLGYILRVQEGTRDRQGFVPVHPLFNPLKDARKPGRQKNTSKEKGLRGNAIWLKVWLEK